MKHRIVALLVIAALPLGASAHSARAPAPATAPRPSAEQAHRTQDIARHRQMARAHEAAAQCLEAGTPEKQCQERLREACKGIAVGQYCGMRHAH